MVNQVTKTIVSKKQENAVPNTAEYASIIVPVGKIITAELKVNGVVVAIVGPWISTAEDEKNALAQLRLRVIKNCEQKDFITKDIV